MERAVVSELTVRPGDIVNEDICLMTLLDMDQIYIDASVPEELIADVFLDSKVEVWPISDKSKVYKGEIVKIADRAIEVNGETIVPVEIKLLEVDEELKPGYNVEVHIITE